MSKRKQTSRMTILRTALVYISLLPGTCRPQLSQTPPNGSFGFSFGFIEVAIATDQPTPQSLPCWLVGVVAPNSPAEKAGIKPGDKVLYVNGEPATKAAYEDLKSADVADLLLQRPDGTIYGVMRLRRATGLGFPPAKDAAEQQKAIDGYLAVERQIKILLANKAGSPSDAPPNVSVITGVEPDPTPVKNLGGSGGLPTELNAANGQIVGTWSGGKSEHDYLHGGYVSADWTFTFSPNGTYEEEVFVGGHNAMSAGGTYSFTAASKPGDRTVTNLLSFKPGSVEFADQDLARVAASFPVPIKAPVREYVNFFRLSDANTMMLQDADRSGSESWQMKSH